jgi:hypothetical protein
MLLSCAWRHTGASRRRPASLRCKLFFMDIFLKMNILTTKINNYQEISPIDKLS